MTISQSRQATILNSRYPFLKNFPFSEFTIEAGEINSPGLLRMEDDSFVQTSSQGLVQFSFGKKESGQITVVLFEQELEWIASIADSITDLDRIRKTLDKGIKAKDLISKRNAVEAAETWCLAVQNSRARLSYSTMGDILSSMIRDTKQLVQIIGKLAALSLKKGLVNLSKQEYEIILTHYHFQLVYTKLILGLVIASKISI